MGASVRAVNAGQLPSFDLVVATVDRVADLKRLLASLGRQTHPHFRVLLVDQNDDDRLDAPLSDRPLPWLTRLRAPRGHHLARLADRPPVHRPCVRLRADIWPGHEPQPISEGLQDIH